MLFVFSAIFEGTANTDEASMEKKQLKRKFRINKQFEDDTQGFCTQRDVYKLNGKKRTGNYLATGSTYLLVAILSAVENSFG
jgi:hypothetical protein